MGTDPAVVVSSTNKFHPAWDPAFKLMDRFWPDRPWDRYIITESKHCDYEGVTTIHTHVPEHKDKWGESLRTGLQRIPGNPDWVFLVMEDYFLLQKVDTENLKDLFKIIKDEELEHVKYLRVQPWPAGNSESGIKGIEYIDKGARYSCSLQAAFWDRKYLIAILNGKKDPWSFETGTAPFKDIAYQHYSLSRGLSPYPYTIAYRRGGGWQEEAMELCKKEGIECPSPIS